MTKKQTKSTKSITREIQEESLILKKNTNYSRRPERRSWHYRTLSKGRNTSYSIL